MVSRSKPLLCGSFRDSNSHRTMQTQSKRWIHGQMLLVGCFQQPQRMKHILPFHFCLLRSTLTKLAYMIHKKKHYTCRWRTNEIIRKAIEPLHIYCNCMRKRTGHFPSTGNWKSRISLAERENERERKRERERYSLKMQIGNLIRHEKQGFG